MKAKILPLKISFPPNLKTRPRACTKENRSLDAWHVNEQTFFDTNFTHLNYQDKHE